MKKTKLPVCYIIIIFLAIIIVYAGMGAFSFYTFGKVDSAGIFGDMFGAVNALFSGLAMFGVILTIFMQSRELEYQREELELTRNEIHGQREEMKQQTATFQAERFENNFFNLIRTFKGIQAAGLKALGQRHIFPYYVRENVLYVRDVVCNC